jgi:RND family efflux transporter MFP subunit
MRRAVAAVVVTFGVAAGPVWGAVVDCLVTPSAMVKLVFPVSGLLALVEVQRGQVVGKGEVVARLDSSVETAGLDIARARAEAHAGIEAARARLASADRQLARVAGLAAKALVPQTEADAARLERDQAANELRDRQEMQVTARLEAERAARLVDQRILISPIAGVVVDRNFEPGEYVERDPVVTLATLDPVDIEVIAPSEAFGKVALGDFISVTLERPAGAHKAAQVAVLDPFVDAASGTFRIRLTLPNPKGDITAGFRCQAELP